MAPLLLPLTSFLIAALVLLWPRRARLITLVAVLSSGVLVVMLAARFFDYGPISYTIGGWPAKMGIELYFDEIGLYFSALAVVLGLAVIAYLWNRRMKSHFYLLLNLLFGSIYTLIFSRDLFNIFVAMEFLTLASFLLVGYPRRPYQVWASLKYLILSVVGMGLYLLGVTVFYYHTGTLNLGIIAELIVGEHTVWLTLSSALIVTGIAVKSGIFCFSMWLPDAHAYALPAVSALLSGIVVKMGVVVLFRLSEVFPLSFLLIVLGIATGLLGILWALAEQEIKKILAFSTFTQIGYILIGLGLNTSGTINAALWYAVGHGLFKGLLFLAAGTAITSVKGRTVSALLARRTLLSPITRLSLLVGILALSGFPILPAFVGRTLLDGGMPPGWLKFFLGLISLGGVIVYARLLPVGYSRSKEDNEYHPETGGERLAAMILVLPIIFFLPLAWLAGVEITLGMNLIKPSLIFIGGVMAWQLVKRINLRLSSAPFQLEQSIVIIIAGFTAIYALVWFTG